MKIANVLALAATAFIFTNNPAFSQGFSEGAGLWGAGAFGAGVGAAAGSKNAKNSQARRAVSGLEALYNSGAKQGAKVGEAAQARRGGQFGDIASLFTSAVQQERAGKLKDAARLMAQFAQERQRAYGARDPEVVRAYDKAASYADRAGSKADSESYSRNAVDVCRQAYGQDAIEVRQRLIKLGDLPKPGSATPASAVADAPAPTAQAANPGADTPQATATTKAAEVPSESSSSATSTDGK
ncbi:MAG: hypothetical protein K2X93_16860 [Candidatus Obscuribacterales bacterium]|nr:hypothetical protein [Candidatus Obscuribacterales bacterium]